jgi:hypothetical protein
MSRPGTEETRRKKSTSARNNEVNPPSATRVLTRAYCLAAICCRADLESSDDVDYSVQTLRDLLEWLSAHSVLSEFEHEERRLIEAAPASLGERAVIDASWRSEGLAVLSWALGKLKLPPYDRQASAMDAADSIDFFGRGLPKASCRKSADIQRLDRVLEGVHTRVQVFLKRQEIWNKSEAAFVSWFGEGYAEYVEIKDGDLAIRGVPVSKSSQDVLQEVLSISRERRIATGWLLGRHPAYSQVQTDT